jgi:hypothetical protein
MSDYASFQVGAFVSPLTAATLKSLLEDADPALAVTLAYYQAVIQTHLGARWDAEVVKAGLPALAGAMTTLAIPYDPLPFLTQAMLSPPFLALYTVSETPIELTRHHYRLAAEWKLLFVMPPLTPAQYLQLYPFLRAATKVILDRTEQGYEPTYQAGARFAVAAGLEQIRIDRTRYGNIQGADTRLFLPTMEMDIAACERRMTTPGLQTLRGLDGSVQVVDANGSDDIAPFALPLP